MKLDCLSFLHHISDGYRAGGLVGTHQIAHEKIAAFKPIAMFIDHNADMQRPMRPTPIIAPE